MRKFEQSRQLIKQTNSLVSRASVRSEAEKHLRDFLHTPLPAKYLGLKPLAFRLTFMRAAALAVLALAVFAEGRTLLQKVSLSTASYELVAACCCLWAMHVETSLVIA